MNYPTDEKSSNGVLIKLERGDRSQNFRDHELIQRSRYVDLRRQVIEHIEDLEKYGKGSPAEYRTGSGWTHFIDGTRGAGKSTFLSSLRLSFENDNDIQGNVAFFALIDPSRIERCEIILLLILQQLRKTVEKKLKSRNCLQDDQQGERWRNAFRSVAGGLSLFAKDYHPLDELDPELFFDWGLERAKDGANLRSELHTLFATACSILGVKALMLAFDDADTDSTQAINILECIRKYLDAPLVMVIVTGDLELYSLLVRQHFSTTVTGERKAALELQRSPETRDRSSQYLRMIDHLEEQYLLKLFPIRRRMQLQPLWNVIEREECLVSIQNWDPDKPSARDVVRAIVKHGMRVKTVSDVEIYTEFLLKQPLRSVLQMMAYCAPHIHLKDLRTESQATARRNEGLTDALGRSMRALALSSLYKLSVDTDAIAAGELSALTQAVFELSLLDGDVDTAPYLRPQSAAMDIRASFAALSADVPRICAGKPGAALRYMLRGPGSVTLFSVATGYARTDRNEEENANKFRSYMGIGRKEDALDWARRATAIIALPFSVNPKSSVVIPGVIGINRRSPNGSGMHTARAATRKALEGRNAKGLPSFALSIVDVRSASGTRTYASIFTLLGLVEKLLSASAEDEAETIFRRAYPELTISAPDWSRQGAAGDVVDAEPQDEGNSDADAESANALWTSIREWLGDVEDLKQSIAPSAIFLGKVWSRLFSSLQKASDELRTNSSFASAMEMFALCLINAVLVEENEHHLGSSDYASNSTLPISRINPRTSADTFVKKIEKMRLDRQAVPLTAIIATCPLILGTLDSRHPYAAAFSDLLPSNRGSKSERDAYISTLLCPADLTKIADNISIAGRIHTSSGRAARKATKKPADAGMNDEQ
ncbi:hypothetical protein EN794_005320 [Mesorhizobium sp. M00.F.Ca.ET.151.01.1.1]|uniref:hypothetical protein n=1 Tax=Stenotrophomonas pavanii TaxID=487698 RepID=UPI0011398201|nr:hypothetical protein [Stenotrophomonas pavanii]MCU1048440.1 hypothetical protein [Stenotrophomonas maltophilia]TGR55822.1 hypothetical protein EN842_05975 [bacterium M00.F.Ca.ET.199.01.1.1]TGT08884.1 hypothetical protein EN820_01160 [bacterium M00.F.Ca.ET.177.01.1.1]TGT66820.1 hypothetical protein EN813_001165 [Mesorhizobium sp. M00.F.Ca.ET.170.01.1.1]TGU15731.1 hypothetical protein EN806_01160 [bacterium M00.F.Ca.ET.163.01.1.1]TGU98459.1 hypothetical protein EN794_005320 [Mesorhizobium sp